MRLFCYDLKKEKADCLVHVEVSVPLKNKKMYIEGNVYEVFYLGVRKVDMRTLVDQQRG